MGLAILCIALISTFELRARVNLLVNEGVPLMQASSQVLAGVQHSFANLRGWISLRDQKFLDGWQAAWREDIQPALALLNRECQQVLAQACDPQRLHNLKTLLADLRESQWWVQDIAHTPGNDPARVVYLLDVEPSADKLNSVIAALLEEEIGQNGGSERKILLARLAELQNAFAATRLLLREILGGNGLNYEDQFRQQLEWTTTTVAQLAVITSRLGAQPGAIPGRCWGTAAAAARSGLCAGSRLSTRSALDSMRRSMATPTHGRWRTRRGMSGCMSP